MAVVIDPYVLPEKGEFEFYIKRTVNLRVTAEEARRKVQHWLLDQVSYMMGAESPQLVLQEDATVWQVSVILTASQVGRVGIAGSVAVDVQTGEILCNSVEKAQIRHNAAALAATLPAYRPRTEMPVGYDPNTLPPLSHPNDLTKKGLPAPAALF